MTPPTRFALVPREATEEMIEQTFIGNSLEWRRVLAASPNGGCVTAADLERAIDAAADQREINKWLQGFTYPDRSVIRDLLLASGKQEVARFESSEEMQIALDRLKRTRELRAALTALGLTVADAPAGEVVDEHR